MLRLDVGDVSINIRKFVSETEYKNSYKKPNFGKNPAKR